MRYEEIQQGKVVTAYGGPGSLIESYKFGCLKIKHYDDWTLCRNINNENIIPHITDDAKALSVVKTLGYPRVEHFFIPPTNKHQGDQRWRGGLEHPNLVLNAQQFPKWYFCPQCHKLGHIDWWEKEWDKAENRQNAGNLKAWNDLNTPHCVFCARKATRRKYFKLEQMRYVAASENCSDIIDIPWDVLLGTRINADVVNFSSDRMTDANGVFINLPDFKYITSSHSDNLQDMQIRSDNVRRQLGDLTKIRFIREADGMEFRMVVRSASNVYIPKVYNSLFVPYGLSAKLQQYIDMSREIDSPQEFNDKIDKLCVKYPGEAPFIRAYADGGDIDMFDSDKLELNYIIANERINDDNLICIRENGIAELGIKHLYNIQKLRETSILYGYTRLDSTNVYPIANNPNTIEYMPCIKRFGEGILVELDETKLGNDVDKMTIMHTFAHAVIKEMEFECGYDSASFKEKIYIDADSNKYGFIVYCTAGSDGSMGGVTSLFNNGKVYDLIRNAVARLQMCPHDPICSMDKGHCYACLDLSEVTCRENNDFLNRNTLSEFIQSIRP